MGKDIEKHSDLRIFCFFPDVFVRKSKSFGQNIAKQVTGKFYSFIKYLLSFPITWCHFNLKPMRN